MTRPGVIITSRDSVPPRAAPTDTSQMLAAGLARKGPAGPVAARSMADYERLRGPRTAADAVLYDAADAFFRQGGTLLQTARTVGAGAKASSLELEDAEANAVLKLEASSVGDWGDDITVEVAAATGSGYRLIVTDGNVVEASPDLADNVAAKAWLEQGTLIGTVTVLDAAAPKVAAAANLAGGTDDRDAIADADWKTALDGFTSDLGPGQVTLPGVTTEAQHIQLLEHAQANNRVALLDAPDTDSAAAVKAAVANLRARGDAGLGQMLWPQAIMAGRLPGSSRTVPYSAVQAGIIARNDQAGVMPNDPAAGDLGVARQVSALTRTVDQATLEDVNAHGVTCVVDRYGQFVTYGLRSVADPAVYPLALQFGAQRLVMAIVAQAGVVAERHLFRLIDGQGLRFAQLHGDLQGVLTPYWVAGALFGSTPQEAFEINVGPAVNTPETIADGQLRAVITMRVSPAGELVQIEIVRVPVSTPIAA